MRRRFLQTYKQGRENLTLVSLEDNNEISLSVAHSYNISAIEMKVNGNSKWAPNGAVILNKGDFIEYRGTVSNMYGVDRIGTFIISKKVDLYGDCTSILKDRMLFTNALAHLFDSTPVVNIHSTFLPATTLAEDCYCNMFRGCTSLVTAPELPATTLVNNCYYGMFYGCTSLTSAPELPATKLVGNCYSYMFYGCNKLNYIKAMFISGTLTDGIYNWVNGVASSGTFVKNPAMTSLPTGSSGIPYGWTVKTE